MITVKRREKEMGIESLEINKQTIFAFVCVLPSLTLCLAVGNNKQREREKQKLKEENKSASENERRENDFTNASL